MDEDAPSAREVALRVMIMVTLADGDVGEDEITRIRWVAGRLGPGGEPGSDREVRAMLAEIAAEDGLDLGEYLTQVAPHLREDDKRSILKAAFVVACADGRVVDEEDAILGQIGRSLGISPAAYRATLRHMVVGRDL